MLRLAKAVGIGLQVLTVLERVVVENRTESFDVRALGREFDVTIAPK